MMKEKTIDAMRVTLYATFFAIIIYPVFIIPYLFIIVDNINEALHSFNFWTFFVAMLIAIFIHEGIHALVFSIFCKEKFKSVKFGFMWKSITPYCHCKELLTKKQYTIALIMPTIILGFIPVIVAYTIQDFTLLFFGCTLIISGFGDFFMLRMMREVPEQAMIKDHPNKVGFYYIDDQE